MGIRWYAKTIAKCMRVRARTKGEMNTTGWARRSPYLDIWWCADILKFWHQHPLVPSYTEPRASWR